MKAFCRTLGLQIALVWLLAWASGAGAQTRFQLVESVPVETSLGIEETARTLPVWLEMIRSARKSLDIEIFYLSNKAGEPLEQVVAALREAARRGVRVRIIVDGKFYHTYPQTLDELNQLEGIRVRPLQYFDRLGGVLHAKYFVVDGRELFIGSQNFDWRALKHIHELGVRIAHPGLAALVLKIFELDWRLAGSGETSLADLPPLKPDEVIDAEHPVQIPWQGDTLRIYPTFSPIGAIFPGMTSDESALLNLIHTARQRVAVQLLTYSPYSYGQFYPTLDDALREAATRKVTVQLLVSDWNKRKPGLYYLQSLVVLPHVQVKFSTIPPYSGGFIPYARVEHCKYLIQDDRRVWIGTANWGKSYFYQSRNVGLVIESRRVNALVSKVFQRSWSGQHTYPVDACQDYEPPRIGK